MMLGLNFDIIFVYIRMTKKDSSIHLLTPALPYINGSVTLNRITRTDV